MYTVMRYFFIAVCLLGMGCSATTTIYLVRHAEKQVQDPNKMMLPDEVQLSEAGHARALILRDSMQTKKITAVFATTITRTRQTVQPTAAAKGQTINSYPATQPAANRLIDSLSALKGKHFLIAGHSNTVPAMIRHLALPCSFTGNIPDNDYDNYFVITIKKGTKTLREGTYGPPSP